METKTKINIFKYFNNKYCTKLSTSLIYKNMMYNYSVEINRLNFPDEYN